jgi:flagellar basal body-associated protein FliL
MFTLRKAMNLILNILVVIVLGIVGLYGVSMWFVLRKREQDYLYNLQSRELRIREQTEDIKVDYYRQLITDGKFGELKGRIGP